jgi:hypothetical protein
LYRLMEAMGPTTGWTGRFLDSSSWGATKCGRGLMVWW